MTVNFFNKDQINDFLDMCHNFYNCGASLHTIPKAFMETTFYASFNPENNVFCYKIEYNGQIAGYALVCVYWSNEVGGKVCFLDEFFIKEEFRGASIGKKFIAFLIDEYKYKVKRYRLEVCDSNSKAINLYKSYGFNFLDYKQMVKENL